MGAGLCSAGIRLPCQILKELTRKSNPMGAFGRLPFRLPYQILKELVRKSNPMGAIGHRPSNSLSNHKGIDKKLKSHGCQWPPLFPSSLSNP